MAIRVECYAGYRGEQEPLAFWLGERRLAVRAVIDRWFAPTQRWFKVDADDETTYVLRQDEASGDWEIAAIDGPRTEFSEAFPAFARITRQPRALTSGYCARPDITIIGESYPRR
jgi:hypothetical protein